MVVGSKRVTSTTTVATRIAATPTPASTALPGACAARSASPRSSSSPFTATTTKLTRSVPPDARQRPRRRDVVERDAEVGPREPAEREATPQRLEHHPHRGGEERRRRARAVAYAATSAPTPAIASAIATTSGTMATYPK